MFCAGLLLSIADLLMVLLTCDNINLQNCSRFLALWLEEHGGDNLPPRSSVSQRCAAWQVAASTIRCPPALFNLELAKIDFPRLFVKVPAFFSDRCCVQSPA